MLYYRYGRINNYHNFLIYIEIKFNHEISKLIVVFGALMLELEQQDATRHVI